MGRQKVYKGSPFVRKEGIYIWKGYNKLKVNIKNNIWRDYGVG